MTDLTTLSQNDLENRWQLAERRLTRLKHARRDVHSTIVSYLPFVETGGGHDGPAPESLVHLQDLLFAEVGAANRMAQPYRDEWRRRVGVAVEEGVVTEPFMPAWHDLDAEQGGPSDG